MERVHRYRQKILKIHSLKSAKLADNIFAAIQEQNLLTITINTLTFFPDNQGEETPHICTNFAYTCI